MVVVAHGYDATSAGLTIVLTGAESAGKTTLAEAIAAELAVPCVAEFARSYFAKEFAGEFDAECAGESAAELAAKPHYEVADLVAIARGQWKAEEAASAEYSVLVADTDLLVIRIWCEVRFGHCDPEIASAIERLTAIRRKRLYLIPYPDIPWEPDPLREHPVERLALHNRHLELMRSLAVDFVELRGTQASRLATALAAIAPWQRP